MNNNQIFSLIRQLLNLISGAIVAYTATKSQPAKDAAGFLVQFINGPDALALVMAGVAWLWGHVTHATTGSNDAGSSPKSGGGAALALFLIAGTLLSGCQSTPQRVAYQSAGTTVVSADTAMHLWGAYVAAHHPGTNLEAQVKSAFEKYQASVAVLCDAGAIYSAAGTNTTASAAFSQATANAGQTLLDLENLLTAAGVKLQ
ncbi:MAG: hypothetical protein WCS94_08275 [Verrucomicrobiota bacterium]